MSENNKDNNILTINLSSIIMYSGIIIFLWFAFQTLFQILSYNIMRELGGGDDKLKMEELKLLEELLK